MDGGQPPLQPGFKLSEQPESAPKQLKVSNSIESEQTRIMVQPLLIRTTVFEMVLAPELMNINVTPSWVIAASYCWVIFL